MFRLKRKEDSAVVSATKAASLNFPPNHLISRRFHASGPAKQFCRALICLGLGKGLLSLSHSSASPWDGSCVGMLRGGTLAPSLPVRCCCYAFCRRPILCKVLGKDKRWPLAQKAWNLAYLGPRSNILISDLKPASPSKAWPESRRGVRLWPWAGLRCFWYQNIMFTGDIIWSKYRPFLAPAGCS